MKKLLCLLICSFVTNTVLAATHAQNTIATHPMTVKPAETPPSATTQTLAQYTDENQAAPEQSVIEEQLTQVKKLAKNSLLIALYRPTYILPYYYTASPDYAAYANNTPNNQKIMRNEFKSQLSLLIPVWSNMFNKPDWALNIAYTQLNFWQIYASSQYFRETNYEPEIFVENHHFRDWLFRGGFNHQSNGRGGSLERSWNRAIGSAQVSGDDWLISLKVWALIFKADSSNLHNPDIAKFLGHENLHFSYRLHDVVLSLEAQNLESGLRRGFLQATVSYPLLKHFSIYGQFFTGYGQSLIEYDHRTNGAGIGIAFNDWV